MDPKKTDGPRPIQIKPPSPIDEPNNVGNWQGMLINYKDYRAKGSRLNEQDDSDLPATLREGIFIKSRNPMNDPIIQAGIAIYAKKRECDE